MTTPAGHTTVMPGPAPAPSRQYGDRVALRAKVARRYRAGASIRAIAAEIGRSYGLVHRLLEEARVPRRARGGRLQPRNQK